MGATRHRIRVLIALVLLLGLGASWEAARRVADGIDGRATARFQRLVDEQADAHRVGRLRGRAGVRAAFIELTGSLTRERFRRYVKATDLARQHPGMQGMNHQVVVRAADRAAFERAARRDGPAGRAGPAAGRAG